MFQVTGQQLSVAATRRAIARIEAFFGGHLPSPAELLRAEPGQLREAGLSWRKISTLRDLAERLSDGCLSTDILSRLPDDELMVELTAIPGIGSWTVQGALIIALQREERIGSFGTGGAAPSTTTLTLTTTTRAFDPALTSSTGDLWEQGAAAKAAFAPVIVQPGHTTTLYAVITPTGKNGWLAAIRGSRCSPQTDAFSSSTSVGPASTDASSGT